MDRCSHKVYCAGPLFNPKEREEMAAIASVLKNAGYCVFLPQENGLKFAELVPVFAGKGIPVQDATTMLNMAIFSLDVFQIMDSEGLVLNMNGRVPDEGAMVEAGIAWSHNKAVVIFRNDDRSLLLGNCNPLVMGLSDFQYVDTYEDIPPTFERRLTKRKSVSGNRLSSDFQVVSGRGEQISQYLNSGRAAEEIAGLLMDLFAEESCLTPEEKSESCSQGLGRP